MQYRQLGRSGLYISNLTLGSWLTYGMATPDDEAFRIFDAAVAGGINCVDTANVYNQGAAEAVIGRWLARQHRSHLVIATKVFFPMSDHPMDRGLSLRHIREQCHASLQRLQTDYIDLYQCHRYDPRTPLEETIHAMQLLIAQGKILHWGVSQWSAVQIVNAIRVCEQNGWRKPVSNQPIYNLLNRSLEVDVMGVCAAEGLGIIPYSQLAQGLLSGKYGKDNIPSDSRAGNETTNQWFSFKRMTDETFAKLDALKAIAKRLGISMPQLAIAWTMRYPVVTSPIIGASRLSQLTENLAAAEIVLSPEVLAEIEQVMGNSPVDQYTGAPVGYTAPENLY